MGTDGPDQLALAADILDNTDMIGCNRVHYAIARALIGIGEALRVIAASAVDR